MNTQKRLATLSITGIVALLSTGAGAQVCTRVLNLSCPPSGDPQSWIESLQVQVNGATFTDPPCNPVERIHWIWGDGTENDAYFPATHTYPVPGEYRVQVVSFDASDTPLVTASCRLEVGRYSTGFETFAPGSVNGQDGWCIGDLSSFPGMGDCSASDDAVVLDDGSGNKVLEVTARPSWSSEIGRDLSLPSSRRYLRIAMDVRVLDDSGFWFMDNTHEGASDVDSLFFYGTPGSALAGTNSSPTSGNIPFDLGAWHRFSIEVDQSLRCITAHALFDAWHPEDDSAGVASSGAHTRFYFRGVGPDSRLQIDDLAITEHDEPAVSPMGLRPDWAQIGSTPALDRWSAAAAYDASRERVVLFGGRAALPLGDTWEFDGALWYPVGTAHAPAPRFWHAMAYDSARQRIVLFGGGDPDLGIYHGDTWEYDGFDWSLKATAHSPPPMLVRTMSFDSVRNRMVLVGGQDGSGAFDATWEYDGVDWELVATASTPPPPGALAASAFDPVNDRTLLVFDDGSGEVATWAYDGSAWFPIDTAAAPPGRWAHSLAVDPLENRLLLFGGYSPYLSGGGVTNDLWEFDGFDWTRLAPPHAPDPTQQHVMVYDSGSSSPVLVAWGETWRLAPSIELLFDNPLSGLSCCSEMAGWTLAEDFLLAGQERLTTVRFALQDSTGTFPANWDGHLQYWLWQDAGGYPGGLVASGDAVSARANRIGFNDWDIVFELQTPLLAQRNTRYWLGLHMAEDWSGEDGLFWEVSLSGFGPTARVQDGGGSPWGDSGHHLVFSIYGDPDHLFLDGFEMGSTAAWNRTAP